jgi:redox-sensitive bicupin YhaK (pirin superfamily)
MSLFRVADIEQTISACAHDLGDGFIVRRALPSARRQMVGPFVFLDSFGPVSLAAGRGVDSRPHPHIGLATLSYLTQGQMRHRDSEGHDRTLGPGEAALMIAGRGIVHSERSPQDQREGDGAPLAGFQTWIALPAQDEEMAPSFHAFPADTLPRVDGEGIDLRLVAGELMGRRAPAPVRSPLFCADVTMVAGARFRLDAEHRERAVYVVEGAIKVQCQDGGFGQGQLVVFKAGAEIILRAQTPARLMLLGGDPLTEKRHVFWNFVSSRRARISQAIEDWREGRFPKVPGETEFTPLPQDRAFEPS